MKKSSFLLFLSLSLLIISCSSNEECKECEIESNIDTVAKADDLTTALKDTATEKKSVAVENKENHEKIVKKYGEQWDFCTCVVANDSINDAFEKGTTSAKQEEKLMARWEVVDNKCKELLTTPNTTPEERAKHDKKVMKCLKQNGLKK
ncbi:hypothetical protein [Fluviicola taffensis]|uniref:Lipoprotein n=1 Tax=Fluviicola taffensis (strain DSM 16823 / NCIMB 13979 / RW262) TaxID=755732 RepID=F2IBP7_FLUTR|nr:hypothetical protein [Fluviicola taffensis]AEA45373.1 hypothetical protein Fluta_3401 [Fluviicola taffensis DSM 16823]